MRVVRIRAIEGPNVYIYQPVLIMAIDLEEYTERESYEFPGMIERLLQFCPGLYDHHCAMGRPGGFVERLYGGTYFGHIIEHVCLELVTQVGYKANFGKTRNAGRPGLYDIIIEYESEAVTRFMLLTAMEMVQACAKGQSFAFAEKISHARQIASRTELGPSTAALYQAAKQRDIPVRRVGNGSLLQLGTGKYRKFVQATMTQNTSAIAVDIASDKALTKQLLRTAGISVPIGGVAASLQEARAMFHDLGGSVVVKPLDGCQGRGVSLDVRDLEDVDAAFRFASQVSAAVIVEEYVLGRQYRLLVVGQRLIAVAERIPAHVIGDGAHSILQLVAETNRQPNRGEDHEKPLTRIVVDEVVDRYLARQGLTVHDVPRNEECIYLRDSANLSTGGIAMDVTQEAHSSFAAMAERVARTIGLDVCGIDVIVEDVRQSLDESRYAVIEVNAAPGIRMHLHPSIGAPQDVASAIIQSLYPQGASTRVPVVSVTGTNGKTTTTRMIRHILRAEGYVVGMTTTEGVYIGDEIVQKGDTTGPQSAELVLADPTVEVAVLETARGGILRGGLAYGYADVGIVTNIAVDHLGQDGMQTIQDIIRVKSLVAECIMPSGIAILNADDPELVALSARLKSDVVLTSCAEPNAAVLRHLAQGGCAFFVRDGWLVEAAGSLEWRVGRVADWPITLDGNALFHVSNALCAIAAARRLGVSRQRCSQALRQFRSEIHNPGRINIFQMPSGMRLISDYGHNPDGIKAVGELVQRISTQKIPAVIGFPGDRNDDVIREGARVAATYFEPLFIKEDGDTRGRRRGEVAQLIVEGVREVNPAMLLHVEYDECSALRTALDCHCDNDLLLMFHENLEPIRAVVKEYGGHEVGSLGSVVKKTAVPAI